MMLLLIMMMMSAHHYSHQSRFARPNLLKERRRWRRRLSLKQDVDWAGNRVAQLQSHVQEVEDNENENQDEHDDTNDDDDEGGRAVGIVCHKCKVIL